MKKIGIITLFGYTNYGNRLQMYATQKVYNSLGFNSEVIKYEIEQVKDPVAIRIKVAIMYILRLPANLKELFLNQKKVKQFKKHAQKHIVESKQFVNPKAIETNFHNKYAFFSVGSDQIWGWFAHPIADFIFLKFAPKEKRIAFSPSFGSDVINQKYQSIYAEGLKGFDKISVREASGKTIIQQLSNLTAEVLCDPTMCLSKEEWTAFASKHKHKPKGKYVVTYFLGEKSQQVNEVLHELAKQYTIVQLNDLEHPKFYTADPSEWVDYIADASLFLTDSFHGVVFSIIFKTPFAVYERKGGKSMQTRITNILEKFQFENRFAMSADDPDLFQAKFEHADKIIDAEKQKAYTFLKETLAK